MRTTGRWIGMLAMAALAAGCGERGVTSANDARGAAPRGPRLTVGPTTSVTVACPTKLETSTSGPCVAFGYDSNGKFASSTVTSWTSSNTSVATVSGGTVSAVGAGTATISATVGGVTGSTSVTVVSAGGTLTVSISGQSPIRSNMLCPYFANVSGGNGSYSYSWSQTTGTGSDAGGGEYDAKSTSTFTLTVNVSDTNGATGSASKTVTISSGAFVCPI